jgi:uncharacterized membrane protein YjgN (DUF898 family)
MGFWKNPFDAPRSIKRAPLPHEDPKYAAAEVERIPDVDDVPPERLKVQSNQCDLPFEFTGDTWEYFRLWTATQALIFLSLGLYAPWARVRRTRYLARHYRLDGIGFEYRADPLAILKGKLIVFSLIAIGALLSFWNPYLIAPLILLAFAPLAWLLTYSFRFRWQTFRYRNIPFGFTPDAMNVFWPVLLMGCATAYMFHFNNFETRSGLGSATQSLTLSMFVFLVAWPYLTSKLLHHRFGNARWGASPFRLACSVGEIFRMLFRGGKAFFFGIVVLFSLLSALSFLIKSIDLRSLVQAISYLLLTVCAVAFGRTRRLNYALNRLQIGEQLTFTSSMEPNQAAWRAVRYGLASVFTLGLAIPWATIDFARWRTQNLVVRLDGEWSSFLAYERPSATQGAIADGLADQFGIEVGW